MKTYWDYAEEERARITEEEIKGLLDIELMSKGVKKITAPELKPIQEVKVVSETWFEVDGVFFKDAETAQKFLVLNPMKSTYDYACGYDYHYAYPIGQTIEQKNLYSQQEVLNLATILKQNKQAKEFNEKLLSEYDKNIKEQNKVLDEVWSDWWRCKERASELQKIIDTKTEYLKMTDNNEDLAMNFLKKIYSEEDIKEALERSNI